MPHDWDYLILTASDDRQAAAYQAQLGFRRELGQLDRVRETLVVADTGGRRIGSGGSTLECLRLIQAREGGFGSLRILILHAGGDSRRLPAYGPCGKIFIPLPGESGTALPLALFDELAPPFLDLPRGVPGQAQIVVAAGDALIRFEGSGLRLDESGMLALAAWASPEEASRHGVFSIESDDRVRLYLQKPPIPEQRAQGAISSAGRTALDIGVMSFDGGTAAALGDVFAPFRNLVLEQGLDLYREICCAMGSEATLEHYLGAARRSGSGWDAAALGAIFPRLREIPFRARVLAGCEFLHFGATRQLVPSGRAFTGAPPGETLAFGNQMAADASISGQDSWIEGCRLEAPLALEGRNVVTGVDVDAPLALAEGACLDVMPGRGRAGEPVWFARCYGIDDTFKDAVGSGATLCGIPLDAWLAQVGLAEAEVWDSSLAPGARSLWNARVIPGEADSGGWRRWLWMFAPRTAAAGQREAFRAADRYSAAEVAGLAGQEAFFERRARLRASEIRHDLKRLLACGSRFSGADLAFALRHSADPAALAGEVLALARARPAACGGVLPPPGLPAILRARDNRLERTGHGTRKRVILGGGVLPDVTQVAVAEFGPGDTIEPHSHSSMWEVFFVLEGRVRYRGGELDDEAGPGDTVLVPPGTRHSLETVVAPFRMLYWGIATGRHPGAAPAS